VLDLSLQVSLLYSVFDPVFKVAFSSMNTQVAGLKSITAKHLALASQTISLFYALIPGTGTPLQYDKQFATLE